MRTLKLLPTLLIFMLTHIGFAMEPMPHAKKVEVSEFTAGEIRLLLNGGYAPLKGFMNSENYHAVLDTMETADHTFWPVPITLPIQADTARTINRGDTLLLIDGTNYPLASIEVEELYRPDGEKEAQSLFGTLDDSHPYIHDLLERDVYYVAGEIKSVGPLPVRSYSSAVLSPTQIKEWKEQNGIKTLVGFQTRNPLHQAHVAAIRASVASVKSDEKPTVLLQPTVGETQKGDIPAAVRMQCYEAILPEFSDIDVKLSAIVLPMRMAGPKEALLHALVRKNHGCTHFIVGRDHAGPSAKKRDETPYFAKHAALELAKKHEEKLGIKIIPCKEVFYSPNLNEYKGRHELSESDTTLSISGTKLRSLLKDGLEIPNWFSYPKVIDILRNYSGAKKGFCVYFTGLPASGKSTLCNLMKTEIERLGHFKRPVVILDADVIRKHLNAELGFSKEDRSKNVRRIGYVASRIVEAGGICLIANIAPYEEDRAFNREQISRVGGYFEVYVDVPIKTCIARDPKGLYQASLQGHLKRMTGVSQNYQVPSKPDVVVQNDGEITKVLEALKKELSPLLSNYLN